MAHCERCDRWFNSWASYQQHVSMSSNHYYCDVCDRDFTSWSARRQHYINSPKHHYCRECDTDFPDQPSLIEHCLNDHYYCARCDDFFVNAAGLHEHNRQSHHYCVECRRVFNSENNLRAHMRSSVHCPKNVPCAFQLRGCTQRFVSKSAMILHLESGFCTSGVDRATIDRWVQLNDPNNVVTVPRRLLTDGGSTRRWIATERSWNRDLKAYECVLCHNTFRTLDDLNRHLASPRHQERIYRCPLSTCLATFNTLSGLCQHIESESCGILRFRTVRNEMERLLGRMNTLRIQG